MAIILNAFAKTIWSTQKKIFKMYRILSDLAFQPNGTADVDAHIFVISAWINHLRILNTRWQQSAG